jgi:hypothetical protein
MEKWESNLKDNTISKMIHYKSKERDPESVSKNHTMIKAQRYHWIKGTTHLQKIQ